MRPLELVVYELIRLFTYYYYYYYRLERVRTDSEGAVWRC